MFDGTLGNSKKNYRGSAYTIEFNKDAKTYHAKAFPIPKTHKPTLKKEFDILIKIGLLKI